MLKEKELRFILLILFFISIVFYEFLDVLVENYDSNLNSYKTTQIGKFLASMLIILGSFKLKWIIKLAGFDYIGGKYVGKNKEYKSEDNLLKETIEHFEIHQSLVKTSLTGVSYDEGQEFYSMWHGTLIDRRDSIYIFSLEVEIMDEKYSGLMRLRYESGNVVAFVDYLSSGKPAFKEKIMAQRVNVFPMFDLKKEKNEADSNIFFK